MGKREAEEPVPRDGRALLSAGGLLLAVAAVFVLGAVLHREVPPPPTEPVDIPSQTPALPPAPAPTPEAVETPGLAGRAARDLSRAAAKPGGWTLQLLVACQEEGVQRLLDAAPGDPHFYVLPRSVGGRDCFAVTWGTFASEAAATAATPPPSLHLGEAPRARALASFAP